MFRKILSTLATKIITSSFGFLIMIMTAKLLGAEAVGNIGLIILGITIAFLVSNFIGGGALIYLVPRVENFNLMVPSYIWAIISGFLVTYILDFFNLIPHQYSIHILWLSIINAITCINQNILLGKEKIRTFNLLTLVQIFFRFAVLALLLLVFDKKNVFSVILSLYIGYGASLIISFFYIFNEIKITRLNNTKQVIGESLKYGSFVQFSNILQLLNYRLSYYIINFYNGTVLLGIFTLGVQLSEGMWFIYRSITPIQYSKISNTVDKIYIKQMTIKMFKLSFILTSFAMIPLILLPSGFYTFIFGNDFAGVRIVIIYLSIGIIAVAVNSIFTHYFSGTGKFYFSAISAFIGLLINLPVCLLLIPHFGIKAAAFSASLSYIISLIFQMIIFNNITKTNLKEYLINRSDFSFIFNELKKYKLFQKTNIQS